MAVLSSQLGGIQLLIAWMLPIAQVFQGGLTVGQILIEVIVEALHQNLAFRRGRPASGRQPKCKGDALAREAYSWA